MLAVSLEQARQLFASGIVNGSAYGLLGVAFALILGVTGRFHFAFGAFYTLTAYLAFTFVDRVGLGFWPAVVLALALSPAVGAGVEWFIYRPLAIRAGGNALLAIFVAALGLGIALENFIRLAWGSQTNALRGWKIRGVEVGGANLINIDLYAVGTAVVLVLLLAAALRYTSFGRAVKATRSNPDMALLIGIDPRLVYVAVFAASTLLAGVAAIFAATKFSVEPSMGFRPVVLAFVVAFFGGTANSPIRVYLTGIGVGLIETMSSLWVSVRWTQISVFVILLVYLVVKSVAAGGPVRIDLRRLLARPRGAL